MSCAKTRPANSITYSRIADYGQTSAGVGVVHDEGARSRGNSDVTRRQLVPRQLPSPPARFTGRLQELSLLESSVRAGERTPRVVVVRGPGGVGKSALAAQWLDSVRHQFGDGQLYAELARTTGEPVAVEDILGMFLRSLGVAADRVPEGLAERVGLYRSMTAGLSMVILLDDAISAAQVRSLTPSSGATVVVVTTKRPLAGLIADGALAVQLQPMDHEAALELLENCVGSDRLTADHEAARSLVALCSGLPVAIRVVAALMVLRSRWTVAQLVDALRDEYRRLDVLEVEDDLSVRATFDVSYHHLSPSAAFVYRVVGVHLGALISTEMVSTVAGMSLPDARVMLDELTDASLLEEVDHDVYGCHDLVHTHARSVAVSGFDEATRTRMTRAILEWHLAVAQETGRVVLPARRVLQYAFERANTIPAGLTEHHAALRWLERHRHDLASAIHGSAEHGWNDLAYVLGDALQPLFILHKHFGEAIEVTTIALRSATALGDPDAETNMRKRLARTYVRLDMFDQAQQHIDQLLHASQARGDQLGIASGLKTLAGLHSRRNRHDEAVLAFAEAASIARHLGLRRREGLTLIDLGRSLLDVGRPHDALDELGRAQALLSTPDAPDHYNAARATILSARAHHAQGDNASAMLCVAEALPLLESVDADVELARAHDIAAQIYAAAGELDRAETHRRSAADIMSVVSARPAPGETGD